MPETPNFKENTSVERKERIAVRQQAYEDRITGLLYLLRTDAIGEDQFTRVLARSMVARDIIAERHFDSAHLDPLTGLPNRRALEDELKTARLEYKQKGKPTKAVMLVDLDKFKSINDTYSHNAGDEALIQTAEILIGNVRQSEKAMPGGVLRENTFENPDLAARMGGEEFVVIFDGVETEEAAIALGERIRLSFEKDPFIITHNGAPTSIPVTISYGIGLYQGEEPTELFESLDKGLYAAKNAGRNQGVLTSKTEQGLALQPIPKTS